MKIDEGSGDAETIYICNIEPPFVIPAQAGIHLRTCRHREIMDSRRAGMTIGGVAWE